MSFTRSSVSTARSVLFSKFLICCFRKLSPMGQDLVHERGIDLLPAPLGPEEQTLGVKVFQAVVPRRRPDALLRELPLKLGPGDLLEPEHRLQRLLVRRVE